MDDIIIICLVSLLIVLIALSYKTYLFYSDKKTKKKECKHEWEELDKQIVKQQKIRVCNKCKMVQDKIILNSGEVIKDWEEYI